MWKEAFSAVAERVGQPQPFEGGWLWPITGAGERAYKTLPETKRVSAAEKSGISPLLFTSTSARPVFVRSGSIFAGLTQERSTIYSFVVSPGESVSHEVRCVHRSRGLAHARLRGAGLTPLLLDQTTYTHDRHTEGQVPYWNAVNMVTPALRDKVKEIERELPAMAIQLRREFGVPKSDDLHKTTKLATGATKHLIARVEASEGEVGIAFTTDKGVELVEWFDSPLSWSAYRGLVLSSLIGVKSKPSEPNRELVVRALAHPFTLENKLSPHTAGLGNHDFTGEYTTLAGKVIHGQVLAFGRKP